MKTRFKSAAKAAAHLAEDPAVEARVNAEIARDSADTSCRKCGAPMKPLVRNTTQGIMGIAKFTVTGYLCSCGHWNNLKRRKAKINPP